MQQKIYNQGRWTYEFNQGDLVLINPHSLELLKTKKGRGKKLLMKCDGPFEIQQKITLTTYRLRMPVSYSLHPILNIAHLEFYHSPDSKAGWWPTKSLGHANFVELPKYEVSAILHEWWKKGWNRQKIQEFLVRFVRYDSSYDKWLMCKQLKNAPDLLRSWDMSYHAGPSWRSETCT